MNIKFNLISERARLILFTQVYTVNCPNSQGLYMYDPTLLDPLISIYVCIHKHLNFIFQYTYIALVHTCIHKRFRCYVSRRLYRASVYIHVHTNVWILYMFTAYIIYRKPFWTTRNVYIRLISIRISLACRFEDVWPFQWTWDLAPAAIPLMTPSFSISCRYNLLPLVLYTETFTTYASYL